MPTTEVRACIDACHACATVCLSDAIQHCLAMGGKHTEPAHFKLMLDCVDICRTAASFMARGSDHHAHICRECAEICRACAESCEALGDMRECVDACRKCADSCDRMAG
ncbi:four-helix bundle copper-binding protein [Parablastomonas sp. CN1-191]|uniref:four-helix bundle copper-binding protein n=1 Tax=Parablastomonas sp. CN1-191 TaxID=3400908 RepID=UPI003BF773F9